MAERFAEEYGIKITWAAGAGSLIERTRSKQATHFLDNEEECGEVLFMLDSDLLFPPKDMLKLIKLCTILKTPISGTYTLKRFPPQIVTSTLSYSSGTFRKNTGLKLTKWVPTGFLAIPRCVLQDVANRMERVSDSEGEPFYPMFHTIVRGIDYISEDYSFCVRAIECGYDCYIDSDVILRHVGPYPFSVDDVNIANKIKTELDKQLEIDWEIHSKAMNIEGWLTTKEGSLLYKFAKLCTSNLKIVEIGSWKGRSTVYLGSGARDGNNAIVYAIDHHRGSSEHRKMFGQVDTRDEFFDNIKNVNVDKNVVPCVGSSTEFVDQFDKNIALLFIDGSHEYELVRQDFEMYYPNVVEGGVIALHDRQFPGPKKLIDEISDKFRDINAVDSIWFGIKKECDA